MRVTYLTVAPHPQKLVSNIHLMYRPYLYRISWLRNIKDRILLKTINNDLRSQSEKSHITLQLGHQRRSGNEARLARLAKQKLEAGRALGYQQLNLARTTAGKKLHFHFCFQFPVSVSSFHFQFPFHFHFLLFHMPSLVQNFLHSVASSVGM